MISAASDPKVDGSAMGVLSAVICASCAATLAVAESGFGLAFANALCTGAAGCVVRTGAGLWGGVARAGTEKLALAMRRSCVLEDRAAAVSNSLMARVDTRKTTAIVATMKVVVRFAEAFVDFGVIVERTAASWTRPEGGATI